MSNASVRIAEQSARPLSQHVADFAAHLAAKGDTQKHIATHLQQLRLLLAIDICLHARSNAGPFADTIVQGKINFTALNKVLALISLGAFKMPSPRLWCDFLPEHCEAVFAELRSSGLSARSLNAYRGTFRHFGQWMADYYRADAIPTRTLRAAKGAKKRQRRQFTEAQARALIVNASLSTKEFGGISGRERALGYYTVLMTGLRSNEMQQLSSDDCIDLTGPNPTIRFRAEWTKNRESAMQPIPAPLALELHKWILKCGRSHNILRRPKTKPMDAMRYDLAQAGIEYQVGGRYADFHALRHTFGTWLVERGGNFRVVQDLMRHSTPELTAQYTQTLAASTRREDSDRLPDFSTQFVQPGTPDLH